MAGINIKFYCWVTLSEKCTFRTSFVCRCRGIMILQCPVEENGRGGGRIGRRRRCTGLACPTPVIAFIGIDFYSYVVAVNCLIHVRLSETGSNHEGTEKFFDENQWRVEYKF